MSHDDLTHSFDANTAWMLQDLFQNTAHPVESPTAARARCAAIVGMFRAFEAGDAKEAMIARHCINLRFVLAAAMRDAGNPEQDPPTLARARTSAASLSKSLFQWMGKYDAIKTAREARQAEAGKTVPAGEVPAVRLPPAQAPEEPISTPVPLAARPPSMVMPEAALDIAALAAKVAMIARVPAQGPTSNGAVPAAG